MRQGQGQVGPQETQSPYLSSSVLLSSTLHPFQKGPSPLPHSFLQVLGKSLCSEEVIKASQRSLVCVRRYCSPGVFPRASASPFQPCSPRKLSSLSLTPQSSAELSFSCLLPPRLLLTLL